MSSPPSAELLLVPPAEAEAILVAGQHVVSFEDLNIDIFLEVQNKRYSQILYLIDYVVPGLHFW